LIFDNPFGASDIDVARRPYNHGTALRLAQDIYEHRAFERLPQLATALEQAGCTNNEALSHCRSPGPHARGCWVVDILLGNV
jgi:hypothetical protein